MRSLSEPSVQVLKATDTDLVAETNEPMNMVMTGLDKAAIPGRASAQAVT